MLYTEKLNPAIAVTVVVPVYNAEKDLSKCLESIRVQTLQNIEIILVDDGSTDGSAKICKEYVERDPRAIYYYKENEGLAAARQDGMERAHGEFVGFVDSDDWIEPNMYARMYSVAKQEKADVVFCGIYADEDGKNPIYLAPGVYDRNRIEGEILPRSLSGISKKGGNDVIRWSNCSRIYSMDLIRKHNIAFDRRFRRSQDLQLTFETALVAERYVSICDEYLYHNRTVANGQSLSRGYTKNFWSLYRPLIDRLYEDVRGYTKQDLSSHMHLCAFFFGASGVRNELYISLQPIKFKIDKLDEIAKDAVLQQALEFVPWQKLNREYQAIYRGLRSRSGLGVVWEMRKYKFWRDRWMPFKRKVCATKAYTFLRGRA